MTDAFICAQCGEIVEQARVNECISCKQNICDDCRKLHADECAARRDCLS